MDTPWTRRYALGVMPIGDAFLAWSKTARPWVPATPTGPPGSTPWWWRLPLLAILAALGTAPWLPTLLARLRQPNSLSSVIGRSRTRRPVAL